LILGGCATSECPKDTANYRANWPGHTTDDGSCRRSSGLFGNGWNFDVFRRGGRVLAAVLLLFFVVWHIQNSYRVSPLYRSQKNRPLRVIVCSLTKKAPELSFKALFVKHDLRLSAPALAAIAAPAAIATPATITAAASAATAVAAATTTASATRRARFAWTCFIYGQRPALDSFAIEFCDCFLRVCLGRHGDERKSARFPGELILHQGDFLHRASLRKKILKISLGRVEGKISYV
jgi:hypothetical protein